jgi:hypothetical protein
MYLYSHLKNYPIMRNYANFFGHIVNSLEKMMCTQMLTVIFLWEAA